MPTRTAPVETSEYAAMLRRMLRSYGRRVADAEPADLADMVALQREFDALVASAVEGQRTRHGYSWTEIAAPLGITRQAARQRWSTTP